MQKGHLKIWIQIAFHALLHRGLYLTTIGSYVRPSQSSPTKSNTDYKLLFRDVYYYYNINSVSFEYDKVFNLLLQFSVFNEAYTQKLLALYRLETAPVAGQRQQYRNKFVYMAAVQEKLFGLIEEDCISPSSAHLATHKDIGHEYFCEAIYLVKHRTPQSCESAIFSSFTRYY